MKCLLCGSDEVIYSGVDAFALGVVTEKVCYSCANIYRGTDIIQKVVSNLLDPRLLIC